MFKRFAIRSLAVLASLIAAVPALAAELPIKGQSDSGITLYSLKIPTTAAINDFTVKIPSCENMSVYWERGNSAQVTMYPADTDDTTAALIDDNTAIKVFTTSERYGPFTPTKAYVSFVVNTVNASGPSKVKVTCSNFAGNSSPDVFEVAKYGGKTIAAVNAALTACDAWSAANLSKGTVMLPPGKIQHVASAGDTSPLITLPTEVNASGDYNASCDLVGYGSVKDYAPSLSDPGGDAVGSAIFIYAPDSMTADATGRKVVLYSPGHEQDLKDFNIIVGGAANTDVDGTTLLLAASADNDGAGADAFCDDGIKRSTFDNLALSSGFPGYGTLFESCFFLDNTVKDNTFYGGSVGWRLTSQASTANNANLIAGNRWAANTTGIYIDGGLACQDLYLHRNTLEANAYELL